MEEVRAPATLMARGSMKTTGASDRASVGEASSIALSPNIQSGAPARMSAAKEDWLGMSPADPAFWLKEVSS
jgi:hypothetical protein